MIFRFPFFWILFFALLSVSSCASSDSSAHRKSFWESFTDFFSPGGKPEGDGELYRELSELDKEIHETEWKYSRENRPQKKSRYKAHLSKLRASRDSLSDVIARTAPGSAESSSGMSGMSAAEMPVKKSDSGAAFPENPEVRSSGNVPETSLRADSVVVTTTVTRFVHDTVFVRDSSCRGESGAAADDSDRKLPINQF